MKRKVLVLSVLVALFIMTGMSIVTAQDTDALVIWADGERAPLLTELGTLFEEQFGIPVEVQEYGLGDARDQLLIAGPAGEGPDILISAHDSLGQFVANGAIVPMELDEETAAQFTEASLELFTYDGELYGIPYAVENVALIRNVNLVPEAPATWDDVRALAEQFQAEGTADYAFVIQTGNTYHNFPLLNSFGGYIFGLDEEGNYNPADLGLNSEGGLAFAEWLSGMYTDGLMPTDVNDDVAFEFFTNGQAGMIVTGPWFSERIIDAAETGGFEYSIDPFPGVEGVTENGNPFKGGQGFVISAFSDKQLEAETFLLDFVATQDFMQQIFDQGRREPAFVGVDTSADPNVDAFAAAGVNAPPMPSIPEMGTVWSASDQALTNISLGNDAAAAYETATSQIRDAIAIAQSDTRIAVVAGSFQDEQGCPADWQPACLATQLTDEDGDGVFTGTFTIPAGDYEYKVALQGGWSESYGLEGGANVVLSLTEETEVTINFDDNTKTITDSVNNPS